MSLAEKYEDEEKFEEAYSEYKKELENGRQDAEIYKKLGHLAAILNKKDESEEYYKHVVSINPNDIVAYEQLMDICFENNDMYMYYLSRGQKHVLEQQYDHAINDFKKAISHCDDEEKIISTRYILGGLYEETNRYNKAIDEYLRITDTEHATAETYLKLANLYNKTDFTESAVEVLQQAKDNGIEGLDEDLAKYYSKTNNPQKALELTSDSLLKARCLMELGRNNEAIDLLESIHEEYKKNSKYAALIAQYYFETGDYDTALERVDEFSKLEPNSPLIYQMRALIYEKKNDEFNEHVNWAKFYILKGDEDIAINEYMTAHRINETNTDVIITIAEMLDKSDKNVSIEFYEKLLDLEPNNKRALQKMAEFYESIGNYVFMVDYLDRLKRIDPRNRYVAENYERANQLLTNPPSFMDKILKFFKSV